MPLEATFIPVNGVFGDLFSVFVVYDEGGPDLVISIVNGTQVTLTVGTTSGLQNLQWDAIAVLFNADSGASALASMDGEANNDSPSGLLATSDGGFAGAGLGQFYSAPAPGPPPPVRPSRLCTTL